MGRTEELHWCQWSQQHHSKAEWVDKHWAGGPTIVALAAADELAGANSSDKEDVLAMTTRRTMYQGQQ